MKAQKTYYAGIYCRLSNDDERKGESLSIENQKLILTKHAKKQGWIIGNEYCDDGYSGTNFDRPAFQQMLTDIKDGKINLVIVKDLSRLGRNHVQVGNFTENILPAFGCRFIALNNNIDTLESDNSSNDMMGFLNLFNEFHSRDTSRKVKSVKKSCYERGMYLGTYAPFGYKKDPDDRHRLVIDEETASIVQRMFQLRAEGNSFRSIATLFNREQIPSPKVLYYRRQKRTNPQKENGLWNESSVIKIIRSEIYIGNMVQGKTGTLSYKSRKIVKKDAEDWIRVENTHEPLISRKLWKQVCELDAKHFKPRKSKEGNAQSSIFTGLVYCADCGFKMRAAVDKGKRKDGSEYRYVSFMCGNYSRSGTTACTTHTIYENVLDTIVLAQIREKARLVSCNQDAILKQILKEKDKESADMLALYQREIGSGEARLTEVENLIQCLYEDRTKGAVPDGVYQTLMQRYEKERMERTEAVAERKAKLSHCRRDIGDTKEWVETIQKYVSLEKLEQAILLELIERIEVSEAQKIDGRRICDVKIIYRMVGDISGIQAAQGVTA